jgi:uncharacterized damage-inducible protein DinB
LTDTGPVSTDRVDPLFQFGEQSRKGLRELVATFPVEQWDAPRDFTIMNSSVRATPRTIVIHIPMHEVRHWAQIATCLRLHGLVGPFHDFLSRPVLGGELTSRR